MRKVEGSLDAKQGYLQIVPLVPKDGSPPVLVNRGWLAAQHRVRPRPGLCATLCPAFRCAAS